MKTTQQMTKIITMMRIIKTVNPEPPILSYGGWMEYIRKEHLATRLDLLSYETAKSIKAINNEYNNS